MNFNNCNYCVAYDNSNVQNQSPGVILHVATFNANINSIHQRDSVKLTVVNNNKAKKKMKKMKNNNGKPKFFSRIVASIKIKPFIHQFYRIQYLMVLEKASEKNNNATNNNNKCGRPAHMKQF